MLPLKYNKEEKVKIKGVRWRKGKLSLIGGSEKHGEGGSGCIFKCGKETWCKKSVITSSQLHMENRATFNFFNCFIQNEI